MYRSHDIRHIGFRRLTVVNETLGIGASQLLSSLYSVCHVELKSQKCGYLGTKKMQNCKDGDCKVYRFM